MTWWLCDPSNLEKSSLLQGQQWGIIVSRVKQEWRGEVGPAAELRRTELSTACPGHGGANTDAMIDPWASCSGPTCKDGFVAFKLLPSDVQAAVREAGLLPQVPQVVGQLTLGDLQHVHVGLAWNVHRVLDDAHLQGQPDQSEPWNRKLPGSPNNRSKAFFDEHKFKKKKMPFETKWNKAA